MKLKIKCHSININTAKVYKYNTPVSKSLQNKKKVKKLYLKLPKLFLNDNGGLYHEKMKHSERMLAMHNYNVYMFL